MKIKVIESYNEKRFADIQMGKVFSYDNDYYLKVSDNTAYNFNFHLLASFAKDDGVVSHESELTILE